MIDNSNTDEIDVTYSDDETNDVGLPDWGNLPTLRDLKQNIQDATSDKNVQDSKIIARRDNINVTGKAKFKGKKGNSSVQPKVIRKQAEWRYSALSEPFLSTEDLYNVSPATHADKKSAKQNETVLNYQFNNKIDKVRFINNYVRAATNDGTVITRTGWVEEQRIVKRIVPTFDYVTTEEDKYLQMHEKIHVDMQSNPESFEALPAEIQEAHTLTMENGGVAFKPIQTGSEEIEVTEVVHNHPTVEVCNPLNLTIDPSAKGNLEKAGFVGYNFETSKADLQSAGLYFNLDKINLDTNSPQSDADFERSTDTTFNFQDNPRKKIVAHEYWGYWDINGDDTLVPIVATWVGNTLIRLEENPYPDSKHPFTSAHYLPLFESNFGETDGDLLVDNQKIIGATTRGIVDLLAKSANSQTGSRKDALDIANKRKYDNGEDYEFNPSVDPRQAFHMSTFPVVPQSAYDMLASQYADAESMTGIKAFHSGISGQSLGSTATGVRSALDATSKRELDILRRLAQGIIDIGKKIIAMNAEFLSDEEVIRITDEDFVTVNREHLAGNFDVKLTISTAEVDNQKAEELAFMLQTTAQAIGPELSVIILADIARLRKLPHLAKQLENYQPQPDPLAQRKAELEIALLEAQIATEQSKAQENNAQAQLDLARARKEGSTADKLDLDYVEQETGVSQERNLQKQKAQSEGNINLELVKKVLETPNQEKPAG